MNHFTQLLQQSKAGDPQALQKVIPLIYDELKKRAQAQMKKERPDHTLQPTALVHEVYIRLFQQDISPENKNHFLALASQCIRRVLVDHARSKYSLKRGRYYLETSYSEDLKEKTQLLSPEELIDLHEALVQLEKQSPRQCQVVDLKYFSGYSFEEIAKALNISLATVKRDWIVAQAWLARELKGV